MELIGRLKGNHISREGREAGQRTATMLLIGERRERSTQAATSLQSPWAGPIPTLDETELHAWSATMNLARDHNHSVYADAYLQLARRKPLALATYNASLKEAAQTPASIFDGVR